ncbi:Protein quiver [Caenorhabditis elegans]|uniref:Protein quiver n=1 Tax=Caenorhabditis elegans TaxID=6239 RepID=Q18337_CAEEL|nr:Protein quiver [Caenorhabditis elegans]CCD64149.1 Protein quiver [Caenorhabditis elegans]|eukprot:NP_500862.3 Uncharacterized protein CELE_C31H1.2 [Caenorhabditis elegans]
MNYNKTFYIGVMLILIGCKLKITSSEIQLLSMKRTFFVCHVTYGNSTAADSVVQEGTEMCEFTKKQSSCVFIARHWRDKGSYNKSDKYQENGCGNCPVTSNEICNLARPKRDGYDVKTVCCCKSPNCLTTLYKDSEIGWKIENSNESCAAASYDSHRVPRWIGKYEYDRPQFQLEKSCFMAIKPLNFTDLRTERRKSRILLEMGYGCPFEMTDDQTQVSIQRNHTYYCCKGPFCNQELYRMIGFELIQNTILFEEEQEFFRRLRYEKEYYKNQNFIDNPHYSYPKSVFDALRLNWTIIAFSTVFFVVIFCSPKNIETLPPVVHRNFDKTEEYQDDDDLVFGEL